MSAAYTKREEKLVEYKINILDGAMGTMLQKAGIEIPRNPEDLNMTYPELLQNIHHQYEEAGSQIVYANTFGASPLKMAESPFSFDVVIAAGIRNARTGAPSCRVALDIGPLGQLMEPMGTFTFEQAYDQFARIVKAGETADLIVIETMSDLLETKAAVLAAKENSSLPVYVTMSFEQNGRTFTGCTIESMAMTLEGLGADAIGFNCSIGPDQMVQFVRTLSRCTNLPIIAKPNAGLPDPATGSYDMTPDRFASHMKDLVEAGASVIGGCCGTDPQFIEHIAFWKDRQAERPENKKSGKVCTSLLALDLDTVQPVGERINPTGKKRFQQALLEEDLDYIASIAIEQKEAGARILDVNVGFPGVDEVDMMKKVVKKLQSVVDLPLLLDSSNAKALEAGARAYNGKPALNSVSGECEKMEAVFPIAKKYGAAVVALLLDENGIPQDAGQRLQIGRRIIEKAEEYGIDRAELWFDALTMTLSAQPRQAAETLKTIEALHREGYHTILGVSNISFGLPDRQSITRTFLAQALSAGLTLPIINVNVDAYMDTIVCADLVAGKDPDAARYIERFACRTKKEMPKGSGAALTLQHAIYQGLDHEARGLAKQRLQAIKPLDLIGKELIPALDEVGRAYEQGILFLPQLLSSARCAQTVFEEVREVLAASDECSVNKGTIVMATVQGDIHDIGKNIVKTVLKNYGYEVIDLGKDTPPQLIYDTVRERKIRLVGLSALMTTTLDAMRKTIELLHTLPKPPKIMVGGAVLTEQYAREMKADYYSRDAQDGVRIAREVFGNE